jgi:ketosteroid isomerase-like protein
MSSDKDVAVVRANNVAFSNRDVDAMLELYAPDAEVVDHRHLGLGSFRGHEELRPYYLSIFHGAEALRENLEVLAARDGVVVCHAETWARLPSDPEGPGFTTPYGMVITMREGRIGRLEVYTDGDEALEASGLERT